MFSSSHWWGMFFSEILFFFLRLNAEKFSTRTQVVLFFRTVCLFKTNFIHSKEKSSFFATVLMRMMNKTKKSACPAYDLNRTDDVDSILCTPCCMCTHTASIHTTDNRVATTTKTAAAPTATATTASMAMATATATTSTHIEHIQSQTIIITAATLWSTFEWKRQCEWERSRAEWINANETSWLW